MKRNSQSGIHPTGFTPPAKLTENELLPAVLLPGGQCLTVAGRQRTAYFYRREAISWRRFSRGDWYMRDVAIKLAKHYLARYRELKGGAQ